MRLFQSQIEGLCQYDKGVTGIVAHIVKAAATQRKVGTVATLVATTVDGTAFTRTAQDVVCRYHPVSITIITARPHRMSRRSHHFVLTMEELEQELCDHVLGHVFALTYGGDSVLNAGQCQVFFFQVMGWPDPATLYSMPPLRLQVYARPLDCQAPQCERPLWRQVPENEVVARPSGPCHRPQPGWFPCTVYRALDGDTGQAQHMLYYDKRVYRPRSEWMLPNYLFKLTQSGVR